MGASAAVQSRVESRLVKVIIVGCGRVGARLALQLDQSGNDVTVVDERVSAFSRLGSEFGGQMVVGNGVDETVLRRAGIERADCFASVTAGDNRNIMAAQIASAIFKVSRVITRIYDPIREQAYRELGLETLCSTAISTSLISGYFTDGVNRAHELDNPATVATTASGTRA